MPFKGFALATRRRALAIVVEPGLADGHNFRSPRQIGHGLEVGVGRLGRGVGMNADARACPADAARQVHGGAAAGQVVADQEHGLDTGGAGALQHGIAIVVEGGIHQVRVRIEQPHAVAPGSGAFLPPMTKVNSPRGACWVKWSSAAAAVPRDTSSKRLVSSRPMATGRSAPSAANRSFSAATTRLCDSKTTSVLSLSA